MKTLTHISLILEGELAAVPATVEVRRALTEECTVRSATLLGSAQTLETLLDNRRVLAVVVGVHLYI